MEEEKIKEFRENNLEKTIFLSDEICVKVIDGSYIKPEIQKESPSDKLLKTIAGKVLRPGDYVLINKPFKNDYLWTSFMDNFDGKVGEVEASGYGSITLKDINDFQFRRKWLTYIDKEVSVIPNTMFIQPLERINVGDYVRITKPKITPYNNQGWPYAADPFDGAVDVVINKSGNSYMISSLAYWLKRDWLSIVNKEEAVKLNPSLENIIKVGDTVTLIGPQNRNNTPGWVEYAMSPLIGKDFVVMTISGESIYTNAGSFYFLKSWLKKRETPQNRKNTMSIGDTVIIIGPKDKKEPGWISPDMNTVLNKEARIIKMEGEYLYLDVIPGFFFLKKWVRPININKNKVKIKDDEIVVGSKVIITGPKSKDYVPGWIPPMSDYIGKEASVIKIEFSLPLNTKFCFLDVMPTYYFLKEWLMPVGTNIKKAVLKKEKKTIRDSAVRINKVIIKKDLKEEEIKFSIGDTVKIKKPIEPTVFWTPNMDRYNNLTGKIVDIFDGLIYVDTASIWFYSKLLEKFVPDKPEKKVVKSKKKSGINK